MPGLIRGVARTAAIAGTATAVSNRVSRRQAGRWADKDQQQYDEQQAQQQQQYAPPPAYAPPPPPPEPPAADMNDKIAQLQQLGQLHEQGILTDEEFYAQKTKILVDPEPPGGAGQRRARVARRVRRLVGRREIVVVGYDGTQTSRPALLWAAAEARRRTATLRVVTVTEHAALLRRPAAELVRSWEEAREIAGHVAAAGATLATTVAPGVDVEAVAQVGSGAAVLDGESRRAAVLVLSPEAFADGTPPGPDMPVSAQVWAVLARRSRRPVVLVRGSSLQAGPDVPVVVGVDGSRDASRAAELAAAFAAGSHAPLRIVCAWVPGPGRRRPGAGWGLPGPLRHDPTSPADADAVVTGTVERVRGLFPDLRIDLRVEEVVDPGSVDRVLAHACEAAAVLVLGRRGHGAQRSLVLGSVSARVVRTANVPVALMPAGPTGADPRGGRAALPNLAAVLPASAAGDAGLILDR